MLYHYILLSKLHLYGICGTNLKQMKRYKKRYVVYNGNISETPVPFIAGVRHIWSLYT